MPKTEKEKISKKKKKPKKKEGAVFLNGYPWECSLFF